MYLAQGAIISFDLGKRDVIGKDTLDKIKKNIEESISYFLKKYITEENFKFLDCTPYNEVFISKGEELKSIVKRANYSKSSLHITLNIDFSDEDEISCSVGEFDSRGRKFAENICLSFELKDYKNKGVKSAEVYNLLYVNNPSIIIDLSIKVDDEFDCYEKGAFIAKILSESLLNLGTK